jgi:peptidoglycan hydrolase CwlO-like protein
MRPEDYLTGSDHIAAITLAVIAIATTIVQGIRSRDRATYEFKSLQEQSRELEKRMYNMEKDIDKFTLDGRLTDREIDQLQSAMSSMQHSIEYLSGKLNEFAIEFAKGSAQLRAMTDSFSYSNGKEK